MIGVHNFAVEVVFKRGNNEINFSLNQHKLLKPEITVANMNNYEFQC